MITFWPAFPRSRAIAFPKPRDDPVTRTTLASSATICIDEDEDEEDADLAPTRRGTKEDLPTKAFAAEANRQRDTRMDEIFIVSVRFTDLVINELT
jgi:hypothetical protein